MKAIVVLAAAGALSLCTAAQERKQIVVRDGTTVFHSSAAAPVQGAAGVRILSMHASAVKGAPYSAEAVTESVQMLADGNRITHSSKSMQYRDSEGRTRIDNSLAPLGLWVPDTREQSISNINDPVSGDHYMLDHTRKVVVKSNLRRLATSHAQAGEIKDVRVEIKRRVQVHDESGGATFTQAVPAPPADVLVGPGPAMMVWDAAESGANPAAKSESLGKRMIEGVECDGTRETLTIDAGQIGNERPIQTVTERWYSPRLQQDVLRKSTDPRFGETTFKLTRISQAEQPRMLFEVPSEYKIEDMGGAVQFMKQRESSKE